MLTKNAQKQGVLNVLMDKLTELAMDVRDLGESESVREQASKVRGMILVAGMYEGYATYRALLGVYSGITAEIWRY